MSSRVRTFAIVSTLAMGFIVGVGILPNAKAYAQKTSKQGDLAKAEIRFFEGLKAYRVKEFDKAISAFQDVFSQTGHPDMLFNIARAYEGLGKPQIAARWYKGLAATKPVDQSATLMRIKEIAPSGQPQDSRSKAKRELDEQVLLALKPVELQSRGTRWLKWGLIGVAGTSLTVAAFVGLQHLDHAKARDAADDERARKQYSAQADRSQVTALGLTGLGLLTGGLAAYLIIDEARPKHHRSALMQSLLLVEHRSPTQADFDTVCGCLIEAIPKHTFATDTACSPCRCLVVLADCWLCLPPRMARWLDRYSARCLAVRLSTGLSSACPLSSCSAECRGCPS